ncbi:13419_t:CDS:2 [Entrophospora sp. SA101]|nr:13419_t:CDS:2 [Entrophospora sp. SA101]
MKDFLELANKNVWFVCDDYDPGDLLPAMTILISSPNQNVKGLYDMWEIPRYVLNETETSRINHHILHIMMPDYDDTQPEDVGNSNVHEMEADHDDYQHILSKYSLAFLLLSFY